MYVSQTILVNESEDGSEALSPSDAGLSGFKLFGWLSEVGEIFVYLELGSCQAILIWLKLWRKLLELWNDSGISEKLDVSFEGLLTVLDGWDYGLVFSHFLKSLVDNFLLDQFAPKLKIFFTCEDGKLIDLIFRHWGLKVFAVNWRSGLGQRFRCCIAGRWRNFWID